MNVDTNKLNEKFANKINDIRLKLNEARRLNSKAVLEEERKAIDPNYNKNKKIQKIKEKKQIREQELEFKGLGSDQLYMNQTAHNA